VRLLAVAWFVLTAFCLLAAQRWASQWIRSCPSWPRCDLACTRWLCCAAELTGLLLHAHRSWTRRRRKSCSSTRRTSCCRRSWLPRCMPYSWCLLLLTPPCHAGQGVSAESTAAPQDFAVLVARGDVVHHAKHVDRLLRCFTRLPTSKMDC
jgi:hypothetical protein